MTLPALASRPDTEVRHQSQDFTVDVITDEGAFLALETEWNEAVDRAAIPHPFLRHEWVRTWWEAFGGEASLFVVLVRASGAVVAIAPLMCESTQMYGLPVRCIRFLANDHTPRTDIIVTTRADEAYREIWRALHRLRREWDVLELMQLPEGSPTVTTMAGLAERDRCTTGLWPHGNSPYLALTGTWEQYLESLPAKFRSNIRNRVARLTRAGEPALEVLTSADDIEWARADAWRLETSGWKREEGTAIASDPAVDRFYTQLAARGAAAGWLQLMFLTVGGRRVATSYGAVFDKRLFLFKTGYDPEFSTGAPFKVLTYHAIRRAFEVGLNELDFLGDCEPWKLEWTTTTRQHEWLFVFADSVRGRLLRSIKFRWIPELKRLRA